MSSKEQELGMEMIKLVSESKFTVYLVYSHTHKQQCALKVFNYADDNNKISSNYLKESRFLPVSHPNVINFYEINEKTTTENGSNFSYILQEWADFGSLY
mmetsp:Transcript_839/g.768  ORF Transcript_839/g.768 Transcript_839/m.768 type:complete len:100 (-) Transcript_839:1043-1342(-)